MGEAVKRRRPSKCVLKRRERIIGYLARGCTQAETAKLVGCHRQTVANALLKAAGGCDAVA